MQIKQFVYMMGANEAMGLSSTLKIRLKNVSIKSLKSIEDLVECYDCEAVSCLVIVVKNKAQWALETFKKFIPNDINLPCIIYMMENDAAFAVQIFKEGVFDLLYLPAENTFAQSVERALAYDISQLPKRQKGLQLRKLINRLTKREREVMLGVTQGKTNKMIGVDLGIAQVTVDFFRGSMMEKLEVKSVAELVKMRRLAQEIRLPLLVEENASA